MTKKTLAAVIIAISVLGPLAQRAEAVKWPSSLEDVENMSDRELRAVIEDFELLWFHAYAALWRSMGRNFDAPTPSEFQDKFPATFDYAMRLYRQATATSEISAVSAAFSSEVEDICDNAPGIDLSWAHGAADVVNSILMAAAVALRNDARVHQWASALEKNLRSDFERTCPDCTDTEISDFVELWVKETADAALLYTASDWGRYEGLAIQFMLAQKCYIEACEREVVWITFCDKYPDHITCRDIPDGNRSFPCGGGPNTVPEPPLNDGPAGGTGGSGGDRPGGGRPQGVSGRNSYRSGTGWAPNSPQDRPTAFEGTDVIGDLPNFPTNVPPGGGTTPAPGDFVPDDPTQGCFGPCCGDGRGRGRGGGGVGECWRDGVKVPCHQAF